MNVEGGQYLFDVEHSSGGLFLVDLVYFVLAESPVEPRSWGAVKAMFR